MEGYLLKWTNYFFGWRRRYFILHDGVLHYCKDRGSSQRGMIHLEISNIVKHPIKPQRFFIDTGCTQVHLKAYTSGEATEWIRALKNVQTDIKRRTMSEIDPKATALTVDNAPQTLIAGKVGEMWSVHAQIQATIDLIPSSVIKATPGIQRIVSLCDEMKLLASDVLSYVDADQDFQRKTMIPRSHYNERQSFDASMEMVREIKHSAMAENLINEESICFEDAQSHVSESELEEMKQIEIIIKTPVMADRPHRDRLPHLRDPNEKINIWQIVKDSIGKELSRITVPVYFNEPISFIQRFSEDLSYNEILVRAADHPDPLMRLALVASFAVTSYTSSEWRTMKPFNPLLGETFELERDGFHLVTEQVSHHPPISALHCDHQKYTFWASTHVKTSFKGTHLRVDPEGTHHLILKPHNDHFTWIKPQTLVHNIIFGKIWVEHTGVINVENLSSGDKATVNLKKTGWFSKKSTEVVGIVVDVTGLTKYRLEGTWNRGMDIVNDQTGEIVSAWKVYDFPPNFEWSYFLSEFALQLNLPPELFSNLCPTDSRYRPDQRALESGVMRVAHSEKHRLEEKQRATRKMLEDSNEVYIPRWFVFENDEWQYAGGYWECKEQGKFPNVPDIY